ncbi:hypothetical protein [Paenibacillus dakarensis]|uniref:hypothetical protein n=1 Tax=Paenibacillus dakarensis TaxID=1527293 RepID=UPI0006D5834E|nr:hypothetical protein [Paenibacillus dakarensis]
MQGEEYIQRQEMKGKTILKTVIFANLFFFILILVLSVLNGIFSNFISIIIQIVLCAFIYSGAKLAKWIYIIMNTLNIFSVMYAVAVGQVTSRAEVFEAFLNVITIIMLVLSIVTIAILLFSSSVKDFMYRQRELYWE